MKDLLILTSIVAAALVAVGGVVFGLQDRQAFIPPPEAVVESFTRELVTGRYELAVNYLSRDMRANMQAGELRARFEPTRQRIGTASQVSGEREWMKDTEASARALVEAEFGSAVLRFGLGIEQGLWRITQMPSLWP